MLAKNKVCSVLFSEQQHCLSSVSDAQLQSSVGRPCPGERVTFTCTIPSNGHQWRVSSLDITQSLLPRDQGRVITDHYPFQFNVTETGSSIISTATVTATADLNGIMILCQDGIGMLPNQNNTITIIGTQYFVFLHLCVIEVRPFAMHVNPHPSIYLASLVPRPPPYFPSLAASTFLYFKCISGRTGGGHQVFMPSLQAVSCGDLCDLFCSEQSLNYSFKSEVHCLF